MTMRMAILSPNVVLSDLPKVGVYPLYDLVGFSFAELLDKPIVCLLIAFAVVASGYPMTQGYNIFRDSTGAIGARKWNPMIHSQGMKESGGAFAHSATAVEVIKSKLPIIGREVVGQVALAGAAAMVCCPHLLVDSCPILFAVFPLSLSYLIRVICPVLGNSGDDLISVLPVILAGTLCHRVQVFVVICSFPALYFIFVLFPVLFSPLRDAYLATRVKPIWLAGIGSVVLGVGGLFPETLCASLVAFSSWCYVILYRTFPAFRTQATWPIRSGVKIFKRGGPLLFATGTLFEGCATWVIIVHNIRSLLAGVRSGDCCKQLPGFFTSLIIPQNNGVRA